MFVFSKTSSGEWTEIQKLTPSSWRWAKAEFLHGNYGQSVAITDSMLAVKAPFDYGGDLSNLRGVTYIYKRGRDGKYEEMQQLSTPEGEELRVVSGTDMAFLDNFLLVGSGTSKKVYVFKRITGGYQKVTELTASDDGPDSMFGIAIDGRGTQAMIKECRSDSSYLFSYEGGAFREKAKFDGCNAALSGNTIVAQSNPDFDVSGSGLYGGPITWYDLICEPV